MEKWGGTNIHDHIKETGSVSKTLEDFNNKCIFDIFLTQILGPSALYFEK